MGTSGSREATTSAVSAAKSSFREEERKQLSQCFNNISNGGHTFTHEQFQVAMRSHLTGTLIEGLFRELVQISECLSSSKKPLVTEQAVLVCAHQLLTASLDERAAAVLLLCSDSGHVSHTQLVQLIHDLISSYAMAESSSAESQTWRFKPAQASESRLAEFLAAEAKPFTASDGGCSADQLARWFGNSCLVLSLLDAVFRTAFDVKLMDEELNLRSFPTATIPFCFGVDWRRFETILLLPSLFFLNQQLPVEHRRQWKLVFSSRVHGESFSKLANQTAGQGACVVIVKSSDGCTFGAFASAGFSMGPTFAGDQRCFLFSIDPHMAVYTATGYNNNFAYLNSHQQTMPNGLGMGGQLEAGFWSFFLDSEYGTGKSQAKGTTFSSPSLASSAQFHIDAVEVWAVGTRRKPTPEEEEQRTSILDIDPEVKAILAMSGRKLHSEGLRESDPTASSPGEQDDPNAPH